ncbi:disease resistance protein Roq1 isoform X1 [Vigna angularis]|nr:disease resistance protein Roq1 isoform X1 [Vigna angularis]
MALRSCSSSFIYEVFLSFRGEDTRHGFTGNLYKALDDKGIHTFIDDEKLQSGEEITPALLNAIEESRIGITVLSKDYASSSFCLDELTTILDCRTKGLLVIPVFYMMDPSDVRHQKGTYGEALAKHQKRFKAEKLQKWKMALQQVADLSGYHFKHGNEYEHEFIGRIVERVSREISSVYLPVDDYLVGLESKVQEVKKLLDLGSHDGVVIGIHGMGGIGKTTLALAVYNLIAANFDESCFLQNVREESNKYGLKHLQSILLSKILRQKNIILTSWQEGASMIQQRLRRKKVLLILDDVDKIEQLKTFVGRCNWFGPGSRVIITTRDQHLLTSYDVKRTYVVNKLNYYDALQLLTWKTFKRGKADPSYEEVLHRAVTYASGLPLALEVIGSNLVGKSVEEWDSAIEHYKRIPSDEILKILKVSFDTLGREEKNVFLDIACCLKGCKLTEIEHMLRALYDDSMKHHISVLVEKSLIKISQSSTVEMHDLIHAMGRQIDQHESPKEPGKHKRLWLPKDIIQVLKYNTGIDIICLDISISKREETIYWNRNAFRKMKKLKILIIRNGKFSEGPNYFPESLRVLEWHGYPSNCLPSNFDPRKLVICKLPHSPFTSFGFHGSSKKLENLTVLNFDKCNYLTQIPNLSDLLNLEVLSFKKCGSLIVVHDSIGFLNKLKILKSKGCKKLRRFPPLNLTSLEQLELSYCSSLENFPEILGKMGNIRKLSLFELPIKNLPVSFHNLTGLQELEMSCDFVQLSSTVLTPELSDFRVHKGKGWQWVKSQEGEEKVGSMVSPKIHMFWVLCCNLNDDFFSASFKQLAQVSHLRLRESNVTFLPECIKEFHGLYSLDVNDCKHIQEIRGVPPNLKYFRAINCISLTSTGSSMLLNQQLHEAGGTDFIFPGGSIPQWFHKQRKEPSISFWFRNKFPAKVLCLLIAPVLGDNVTGLVRYIMFINGRVRKQYLLHYLNRQVKMLESDYTHLFDLQHSHFSTDDDLMEEVSLEKEWNQVTITYEGLIESSLIKIIGIHVVKEENSSMEDIRYDDPYANTKEDNHLNTSQSQPFLKIQTGLMLTCKFFIGSFMLFSCFLLLILSNLTNNPT